MKESFYRHFASMPSSSWQLALRYDAITPNCNGKLAESGLFFEFFFQTGTVVHGLFPYGMDKNVSLEGGEVKNFFIPPNILI